MKKKQFIIIIIALLATSFPAISQTELFNMGRFEKNTTTRVFGHNVNIRDLPDATNSKVIDKLDIGTTVTILEEKGEFSVNDFHAPWYKIKYTKAGKEIQGYIWRGFLSVVDITLDDGNLFLYGFYGDDNIKKFMSQAKVVKGTEIIAKLNFEPISDVFDPPFYYNYSVSGWSMKGSDFTNVKNIIQLNFNYPACGYTFGDIAIFYLDNKLVKCCEAFGISEAGVFHHSYELIYPSHKDGKPNKIIIKQVHEEYSETDTAYVKKDTSIKTYKWDGSNMKEE